MVVVVVEVVETADVDVVVLTDVVSDALVVVVRSASKALVRVSENGSRDKVDNKRMERTNAQNKYTKPEGVEIALLHNIHGRTHHWTECDNIHGLSLLGF